MNLNAPPPSRVQLPSLSLSLSLSLTHTHTHTHTKATKILIESLGMQNIEDKL